MASRRDYYYRELVTEAELDAGFEGLEDADRALVTDIGYVGVHYGLGVSEKAGTPNLSVDVAAGAAYDQDGQRCLVPSTQNVSVAADSNGVPTSVSGVGNERWVSVFLVFDRALSDQRTDGNSNSVMFVRDESYTFTVTQGAEAALGAASRPALIASGVLLADVKLVHNQTQVLDADVSTTRRKWPFVVSGSPHALAAGRVVDAFTDVLGWLNDHVSGSADKHSAAVVDYAGGGTWADGTTNPATTVELQLDKIVSDLSGSGTAKVGAAGFSVGGVVSISGGSAQSQIQAIVQAAAHYYAGGSAWLDGTTNPATTTELQLDKIVSDLIGQGASTSGAHKVGAGARTAWLGGRTNPAATVHAALDKIVTDLAATTTGDDGGERIGLAARTAWLDATANAAGSVYSGIDKIVTDLALSASAQDGMAKIGFFGAGTLSTGSGRSALLQLDTLKAALAGATFTGEVKVPRVAVTIQRVGNIAANTQILDTVGVVYCKAPGSNVQLNLALPEPSGGGTQVIFIKFSGGGVGSGRLVYLTDTANLSTNNPTDYYAYWEASPVGSKSAGCVMFWDDAIPTRWRMVASWNLTGSSGGGSLAD